MKKLYEASNSLEAHMIVNLLEGHGLSARVDGEYLQGGIGELPAAGLVKVMVAEEDFTEARQLIEKWEAAQPAESTKTTEIKPRGRLRFFVVGMLAGVLVASAYFRTPIKGDGVDHNGDGTLDETWTYAPSGLLLKAEVDRNFDGKVDYVSNYGRNGTIESAESDDNFDGVFETLTHYRRGNAYLIEADTDGDGYKDFRTNLENGVYISNEYLFPATGLPEKIEYYKLGKIAYAEVDVDRDGKMDQRKNYNGLGEVVSVVEIE